MIRGRPRAGRAWVWLALGMLSGCAIKQDVRPVAGLETRQLCVIESTDVRKGFQAALFRSLRAHGYEVRPIPANSSVTACPVTLTYTASWRWDLALYMAYAELRTFNAGKEVGRAIYDSTRGGGNMGKFIDADKKIDELTRELLPRG